MSFTETTKTLNTSVGELAILATDTFTYCVRSYEALLPYLEKKETKSNIHHKLVHINILLNKLNEELLGLQIEYVTVSSYEPEKETFLIEEVKKRGMYVGRDNTNSIKTEFPFSNCPMCSVASTSESTSSIQLENLVSVDIENTRHTQVQELDIHRNKNVKIKMQNSDEIENIRGFPMGNSHILAAQASCDKRYNSAIIQFAGGDESASMADGVVRDNACNKPTDTTTTTTTQRENNEERVPLQNVESETSNKEKCEDSGSVPTEYKIERLCNSKEYLVSGTTCDTESVMLIEGSANSCDNVKRITGHSPVRYERDELPVMRPGRMYSAEDELYGIIEDEDGRFKCKLCEYSFGYFEIPHVHVKGKMHQMILKATKNKRFMCTFCDREHVNYKAVLSCMKGKKHKRKKTAGKNNRCDTRNNNVTDRFVVDEKSGSVTGRIEGNGDNGCAKPAGSMTHRENNEQCVPLPNEIRNQEKCKDSASALSEGEAETLHNSKESPISGTTCGAESAMLLVGSAVNCNKVKRTVPLSLIRYEKDEVPFQRPKELWSDEDGLYGIIKHEGKKFKCLLCNSVLVSHKVMRIHVKGKNHQMNRIANLH